jgi:lysylphosphatidylglycerol synthetase-like protein (DUF2156 family)
MEKTSRLHEPALSHSTRGWINGLIGVVIFSGSLPATRLAVTAFDPLFLTAARATLAALLAVILLWLFKPQRPALAQLAALIVVAAGVVLGFPLLTALALQHVTAAHSIVFLGLLPLATAIFAVLRGGERPRRAFWIFSSCRKSPFRASAGSQPRPAAGRCDVRPGRRIRQDGPSPAGSGKRCNRDSDRLERA